jgi:hypothetical protein
MNTSSPPTASNAERYARDGFAVLRGLYTADEMLDWKRRATEILRAQHKLNEPSGVVVWMADALDPFFRERMRDECVVRILRELVGENVEFLSVKPVFKNSATTFASPWHQDWHYWLGAPKISVWIALDDATPENGCLKMIPGSHRKPLAPQTQNRAIGFAHYFDDDSLQGMPVETLAVKRGDAVFFHDLTIHASHPNTSGADRWSLISTYRDASVKDDSTIWKTALLVSGKSVNV